MVAAYLLVERKDPGTESVPDPNDADEFEAQLANVLMALSDGWAKRARSRLIYPKSRKGTRHWTPEYDADPRVGNKALDASKAVDPAAWQEEAEQQTHPLIEAAAIAAAVALLIDIGFRPPTGESVREFAVRAVKRTVEYMVGIVGKFAAGQATLLIGDVNEADQTGADLSSITDLIANRADRLQTWSRGVATLIAHGTTNASRDDAAEAATDADPDLDIIRVWYSRRDEKVRPTHVEADGQVRTLGEPFLVGGALLRFPQDPLAPIRETANCRCHTKHRSRRSGRWAPRTTIKAMRVRDGDGDGFVYDGTLRQRPVVPAPELSVALRVARPNEAAIAKGAARVNAHREEARDWNGPTLTSRDMYGVADAVAEAFKLEWTTPTGRSVSVGRVYVETDTRNESPYYQAVGEITDVATGEGVGHFEREFTVRDGQWVVYHSGLTIEPSAQGEGIGSEFNAHAMAWYVTLGVEQIRVNATGTMNQQPKAFTLRRITNETNPGNTITDAVERRLGQTLNGGYTWGQQGFDFDGDTFETTLLGKVASRMSQEETFSRYLVDLLNGWEFMTPEEQVKALNVIRVAASVDYNGASGSLVDALPDDWWDDPAQRKVLLDFLTTLDLDRPPTPWEVNLLGSHLTFIDKDTGLPTWLGKALMSRSYWKGIFNLDWLDLYDVKSLRGRQRERILAALMLASIGIDGDEGLETKSIRPLAHAIALGASIQMSRLLDDRLPRDADSDGFIYDGTPRMRPAPPRGTRRIGVRRLGTGIPKPKPVRPPVVLDERFVLRPDKPLPGGQQPWVPTAERLRRELSDELWDHTGDVGLLDRLVNAAAALDNARRDGTQPHIEAIATGKLIDALNALLGLRRADGTPVLDEDVAAGLTRLLDDLIVVTLPDGTTTTDTKGWYTRDVKTALAGLPRDADSDGFIYDGTPRQRLAPIKYELRTATGDVLYSGTDPNELDRVAKAEVPNHSGRLTVHADGEYRGSYSRAGVHLGHRPVAGPFRQKYDVSHQSGTPLNYRGKFPGDAERLYITEPGYVPGKYGTTGNWEGSPEDLTGYLDYSVVGGTVYIWFLTTRRDREKRGIANALVARLYADHPGKTVEWGELMDDGAEILYKRFRDSHPTQTGKGRVYGRWQTGSPAPVKPIESIPEVLPEDTDPDTPDRVAVYAAESDLPNPIRMRAVTDDQAEEIATRAIGQQVTLLRSNVTPGGLEPGRHIFGVWLPNGPVIAAPPHYPLSEFEVYHEAAHLIGHREGFTGHGEEFREAYLSIVEADKREALAAALREGFPKPEWTPDTPGVKVEGLRKVEGFSGVYEGTVAPNTPPLWRNVGHRDELEVPARGGHEAWSAAQGGFTVRKMEGDTQFAETEEQALAWSHPLRQTSSDGHFLIAADLSGLPVRFIGRTDWTSLSGEQTPPSMADHGDGTATVYPNTTAGLGVVGYIPLSRITSIDTVKDGERLTGQHWDTWDEYVAWRDRMDAGAAGGTVSDFPPPGAATNWPIRNMGREQAAHVAAAREAEESGNWSKAQEEWLAALAMQEPDTPYVGITRGLEWQAARAKDRAEHGAPARNPDFGKRVGKVIQRAGPNGGLLFIETIGGRRAGQVVERVVCRVNRVEGVWQVYPPTEQSPSIYAGPSKSDAVSFALAYANGENPDPDNWRQ